MKRRKKRIICIVSILILAVVIACSKDEPPAQSQVISKKISSPVNQQQEPKAVQPEPQKAQQPEPKQEEQATSDLIQASLQIAGSYDPKGRFDPFEPLFKEKPEETVVRKSSKRKKRVPQTPLERVALAQLKLSAIIRAASGNRALVEDATGKGYVIKKGTYIGLNSGQVVRIGKDRVVVEEEVENVLGELTFKNTELKLQKPAGEL